MKMRLAILAAAGLGLAACQQTTTPDLENVDGTTGAALGAAGGALAGQLIGGDTESTIIGAGIGGIAGGLAGSEAERARIEEQRRVYRRPVVVYR
ncbi:MAG TPA: YMGG-like glycine zipper-containing protein [Paracoccaceae bacterium]|nr:YMGG-like glycine zipper-containing protein [Paracoccaceae bacterium]